MPAVQSISRLRIVHRSEALLRFRQPIGRPEDRTALTSAHIPRMGDRRKGSGGMRSDLPRCGRKWACCLAVPSVLTQTSGFVCYGKGMEALAVQLVCGLRDLAALVAGSLELVRGRQARAIAAGDRRGTVG